MPTTGRSGVRRSLWVGLLGGLVLLAGLVALSPEAVAADELPPATPATQARYQWRTDLDGVAKSTLIGNSVGGRPLIVYRFGEGASHRMIVAGIHGGYEWNTIGLAEELLEFVRQRPGVVPPEVSLYFLTSLNPDGGARSRGYDGRANDNGVDLNRNFPHNWQESWKPAGCWNHLPIGGGTHPLSEPESKALARFLLSQHIEALISYHSAALGIFDGGRPAFAGSVSLAEAVAEVTDYPYPPIDTGCEYTGSLTDWAAANGISSVDIELTTHHSIDYLPNLRVLLTLLNWQPPSNDEGPPVLDF
jgi:hypothetical protein